MIRRIKIAVSAVIILALIITFACNSTLASALNYDGVFTFDIGDTNYWNLKLESEEVYHNTELLGAKVNNNDRNSVRFISAVHSDILRSVDDYGYMFYTFKKSDINSDAELIQAHLENNSSTYKGYKKFSCKNSINDIFTGGYGNNIFDFSKRGYTRYKYISAVVDGVEDDSYIIAKFYVEVRGQFHFAIFNSAFRACLYSSTDVIDELKSKIEFVGHRGAMDTAPENTLVSFEQAAQHGYPAVETDFWITNSGDILCLHNENLEKCGYNNMNIRELSAQSRFNYPIVNDKNVLNYDKQYIPTIEEVIKKVSSLNLNLFLHTKDRNTSDEKIDEIISILKKYKMLERTIFVSSSPMCCERLSKHDCNVCYLVVFPSDTAVENGLNLCVKNNIKYFMIKYISGYPKASNLKKAHDLNLRVGVYNANNISKTIWLANNNCDFMIINNYM
ncbi:MAG: glycerophosphodiester phosphodiesterase family protein [Ruminococcus sp.]|nr:glycerophosphodiester phosphodiesterase family protein [Ruminococcus sp.]